MNKKKKKNLIEYGLILVIFAGLYFTGYHTEVLGFLQRGILATGIMNPDLDKDTNLADNKTQPVADFSMSFINSKGERVDMEDLRGKVIFLNIWATWCPPCVAEMPGINKLYKDVDKDKVAFIMLSVDQDFQKAIDFNSRKGYDFEVYAPAGVLPSLYQSASIPTTYVIDASGKLVLTHTGMGDYYTKKFKEFLKEQY
ncbi:TlpA family protein disulfide reductase [Antarcticibacterium flavum]|uniref:TlpA family protein disulfide reductase n=1 Tax=Antarcticibacterium flavum TaxID=2058175 RepID=A0A5B7X1D5_9FLAO|nr:MULTISPECIES: TlpA disulfide reductase family protein [Antarcticibacterium]MCM4158637.1 thioredoxin [Antarcticibacterium sp. W02-3]QCY68492.1 TlpA family protein disulfide reductase [Antarcticibacterium flavum]